MHTHTHVHPCMHTHVHIHTHTHTPMHTHTHTHTCEVTKLVPWCPVYLLCDKATLLPVHKQQVGKHSCTEGSLDHSPVLRVRVKVSNVTPSSSSYKATGSKLAQELSPVRYNATSKVWVFPRKYELYFPQNKGSH